MNTLPVKTTLLDSLTKGLKHQGFHKTWKCITWLFLLISATTLLDFHNTRLIDSTAIQMLNDLYVYYGNSNQYVPH